MQQTTSVITGATSGIGAETALGLARLGSTVVIVARNRKKGIRRIAQLERVAGRGNACMVLADLSSQTQVRHAAEEIQRMFPRIDILVNNAGAYFARRMKSADGIEMNLALNHLAYFSLTLQLIRSLQRSPAARIINVSSDTHRAATIDFEDIQNTNNYDKLVAYARSKLANLLFTYELSRRLAGTSISVNAVHPGAVATNIGANNNWLKTRLRNCLKPGMLSPTEGARTSLYVATAAELTGASGRYFFQCRETRSSDASYELDAAARLWRISEDLTGLHWSEAVR